MVFKLVPLYLIYLFSGFFQLLFLKIGEVGESSCWLLALHFYLTAPVFGGKGASSCRRSPKMSFFLIFVRSQLPIIVVKDVVQTRMCFSNKDKVLTPRSKPRVPLAARRKWPHKRLSRIRDSMFEPTRCSSEWWPRRNKALIREGTRTGLLP